MRSNWTSDLTLSIVKITHSNPFQSNVALLYTLKASENPKGFLRFSGGKGIEGWAEMS